MVSRFSTWIAVGTLLLTGGCLGAPRQQGSDEVPPELTFETVTYRVYRGAALAVHGTADRATLRRDNSDVTAQRIEARFPGTATRPAARVTAARGTGNVKARRFLATGGVRGEQAGQVAVTEEARYTADEGVIRGEKPIQVQRAGRFTARGPGFVLDPRDQVLRIEGGARVVAGEGRR
jgi:hypothetical protein